MRHFIFEIVHFQDFLLNFLKISLFQNIMVIDDSYIQIMWIIFERNNILHVKVDSFYKFKILCLYNFTFWYNEVIVYHFFQSFENNSHLSHSLPIDEDSEKVHHRNIKLKCDVSKEDVTCSHCFKQFLTLCPEEFHLKDSSYVCTCCSKEIAQFGNLSNNLNIHSDEKTFECEVCSKTFKRSCHLSSHLKVHKMAETVGISKDWVGHILNEILGMRKLSARWVPRLLTPDNKRNHETTSEQCLTLFKRNPKEFLRRFVTVDETWIHWYTRETKEQSKQWTSPANVLRRRRRLSL